MSATSSGTHCGGIYRYTRKETTNAGCSFHGFLGAPVSRLSPGSSRDVVAFQREKVPEREDAVVLQPSVVLAELDVEEQRMADIAAGKVSVVDPRAAREAEMEANKKTRMKKKTPAAITG